MTDPSKSPSCYPANSYSDHPHAVTAMQNRLDSAVKRQTPRGPVIHVLANQVALRVVCPASAVGGIIGLNGATVSQLRRETSAKIHCHQPKIGSEHWVVFIVGSTAIDNDLVLTDGVGSSIDREKGEFVECEVSLAQAALIRVLERLWAVLAEKDRGGGKEEEEKAYCGILAGRTQIGAVLGRGGKNVAWMREETGAKIRVLPPPACGTNSDKLIQVTGRFLAVKKALIMISGCLQDCPPLEGYPPPLSRKPFETFVDGNSEDPHSEFFPHLSSLLPRVTANNAVEAASSGHLSPAEMESRVLNLQPSQSVRRGHSLSGSDGKQDLKIGTELDKLLDFLLPTEVVNKVGQTSTKRELKYTASSGLQENDLRQGMKELELSSNAEVSSSPISWPRKQSVSLRNISVEIAVGEDALDTLYGRDRCGLHNLQQVSGAKMKVEDPLRGEARIVISGSPEQIREAMSLIVSIVADHRQSY